jgi:hypothetical protein
VSQNRLRISTLFGLGACGLPPDASAREAERIAGGGTPVPTGSYRDEFGGAVAVAREATVALLIVVLGTQVATDNPFITRHVRATRPAWMAKIVNYGRLLEGWGMFAPEPPFDDGVLVVDGRTKDGRKFDPFTGKEPDFDPFTRTGWDHDQIWCDYSNHIRWPHNQARRQFLREYLQNQHVYSGRPQDQLVAFDVWWIQDKSPLPGQLKGKALAPERLVSHGYVKDSGAVPWQPKGKSTPRRTPPPRPVQSARPEARLPAPASSGAPSVLMERNDHE